MSMPDEIINDRASLLQLPVTASTSGQIVSEVRSLLESSPFLAIRSLRCGFHDGVVVLKGRVPTFFTLQVALTLVMKVPGVDQVDDRIAVDFPTQNHFDGNPKE